MVTVTLCPAATVKGTVGDVMERSVCPGSAEIQIGNAFRLRTTMDVSSVVSMRMLPTSMIEGNIGMIVSMYPINVMFHGLRDGTVSLLSNASVAVAVAVLDVITCTTKGNESRDVMTTGNAEGERRENCEAFGPLIAADDTVSESPPKLWIHPVSTVVV